MYFASSAKIAGCALTMASAGAACDCAVVTSAPCSTSGVTAVTSTGMKAAETATTIRIVQPHTARPAAVAAGLCFSTVSVKLAIHGA